MEDLPNSCKLESKLVRVETEAMIRAFKWGTVSPFERLNIWRQKGLVFKSFAASGHPSLQKSLVYYFMKECMVLQVNTEENCFLESIKSLKLFLNWFSGGEKDKLLMNRDQTLLQFDVKG